MSALDAGHLEQVTRTYIATFAGRADAYVQWTGSQYIAVRQPLTAEVVLAALRDRKPIGAYFLMPDSSSHVAALDLDRCVVSPAMALPRDVGHQFVDDETEGRTDGGREIDLRALDDDRRREPFA